MGLGLALLAVAAPAPAYVVEAVTTISAAEGEDLTRLDGAIQAAIDHVAAHAVTFTPTVAALLDAALIPFTWEVGRPARGAGVERRAASRPAFTGRG